MKKLLRGKIFENRERLEEEVRRTLLFCLPREEFATAIDATFRRWQKCVRIRGDFVEKIREGDSDDE